MYFGCLWIWRRPTVRPIGTACGRCRVYGFGEKLLKAVEIFYVDSMACVRVGNDVSEWFPVNVGLRQGCHVSTVV